MNDETNPRIIAKRIEMERDRTAAMSKTLAQIMAERPDAERKEAETRAAEIRKGLAEEHDAECLAESRFDEFLDEFGERNEVYAGAIELLKLEATPEQMDSLRKLLHQDPPWKEDGPGSGY